MVTVTYVLVDFENLQPPAEHVAQIRGEGYRLWVFHGPHQNKFAAEMVVAWQPLGDQVRFIQSSKPGKNALDFHIAFCLGQAQQQDATAAHRAKYIVVSNDGGFDPLFDYMRSLGCAVGKAASIPEALTLAAQLNSTAGNVPAQPLAEKKPAAKKAAKKSANKTSSQPKTAAQSGKGSGAFDKVLAYLRAHPENRPTTRKALGNHLPSMLGGKVTDKEVSELMAQLVDAGVVETTDQKIEYKFAKSKRKA